LYIQGNWFGPYACNGRFNDFVYFSKRKEEEANERETGFSIVRRTINRSCPGGARLYGYIRRSFNVLIKILPSLDRVGDTATDGFREFRSPGRPNKYTRDP